MPEQQCFETRVYQILGTPTFFVNEQTFAGMLRYTDLAQHNKAAGSAGLWYRKASRAQLP